MSTMSDRKSYLSIQYLRAFAALLVVITHAGYAYEAWMKIALPGQQPDFLPWYNTHIFGVSGVHLFFVISGFIMASQEKTAGAIIFGIRRVARVVPMYWLCTAIFVCISLLDQNLARKFQLDAMWPKILASLFFVSDFHPVLPVGWTLNYEMFFYLVFGVAMSMSLSSLMVAVFFLALVLLNQEVSSTIGGRYGSPVVLEFALGIFIYHFHKHPLVARASPYACGAGLFLLFSSAIWFKPDGPTGWGVVGAWGVPAALIVLGATGYEAGRQRIYVAPSLLLLGEASYSLYLTHTLMFHGKWNLAALYFKEAPIVRYLEPHLATTLFILLLIAVAIAAHLIIERPLNSAVLSRLLQYHKKYTPKT